MRRLKGGLDWNSTGAGVRAGGSVLHIMTEGVPSLTATVIIMFLKCQKHTLPCCLQEHSDCQCREYILEGTLGYVSIISNTPATVLRGICLQQKSTEKGAETVQSGWSLSVLAVCPCSHQPFWSHVEAPPTRQWGLIVDLSYPAEAALMMVLSQHCIC